MLSFNQSIYIHSHVETPWGVRRLMGGGVWEFRPETRKLEVFCKGLVNGWGREFDRWGQSFLTDGAGSGGINFGFPQAVFVSSPGAKRIVDGLNPGQPKQAGLEIIDEPHFPDDWQGSLVTCDFRGNRINRFQLTESGSGYVSKQLPDVMASKHGGFRPIDVRTGPDGALYIADWYNPIIQHGEVDFRDPRRDHTHGRIWRLTAKGRPLSENPEFVKTDVAGLTKQLESNRRWNRTFAKREIRSRGKEQVQPALDAWASSLKAEDHALLEAAWATENTNDTQPVLIRKLLGSPDHHVRAAALRILSQHLSETPDALKLLSKAITDEHPQVRLWAVACLNLMSTPKAFELALKALDNPMDNNIDFLLELTAREQAEVWLPVFLKGGIKLNENPKHLVYALKATGKAEALQPLLDAFASGKLSPEDSAAVLGMIADVATPQQLGQLLKQVQKSDYDKMPFLAGMLDALIKAGQRGAKPESGTVEVVSALWGSPNQEIASRGALLAGVWKQETSREQLAKWASQSDASPALRQAAIKGLTFLGGPKTRDLFDGLTKPEQPDATRTLAITGLSELAPPLGAKRAAEFLAGAKSANEAKPVFFAFIANKKLPEILAKELEGKTIPEAVAVEGIRIISSRSIKGPLEAALQKAGAIKQMTQALTPDAMQAMMAKVKSQGDPARGEKIFRRQQLLCFTCHAIGDGGGLLGPNLVSLGSAAPVDYIIESLLEPSKKIKEGYNMTMVSMKDGQVMAGMIAQDGGDELVLRDATNQLHKLAKANIAKRETSPVSMMPPGMTASLREDEFVDLVRFLSELGKEGDYKIKTNRFVRTWRAMGTMEQEVIDQVRHTGLQLLNDRAHAFPWMMAYSGVNGAFPLTELTAPVKMYPWFPKILQTDLQLDAAGKVKLKLSASKGVVVAIGEKVIQEVTDELTLDLPAGKSVISFVITRDAGDLPGFSVEILDGAAKVVTGM
jgi:putative heme-binding domain-containing protein